MERKKFNGKNYTHAFRSRNKRDALKTAAFARSQGKLARIFSTKDALGFWYHVYLRMK